MEGKPSHTSARFILLCSTILLCLLCATLYSNGSGVGGVALRCSAAAKAQSDERYWVQLGAPNFLRATDSSPAFTLSEAFLNQPEYSVCAAGSVITSLNVHTATVGVASVRHVGCARAQASCPGARNQADHPLPRRYLSKHGCSYSAPCAHIQVVVKLEFICGPRPPPASYASLSDIAAGCVWTPSLHAG